MKETTNEVVRDIHSQVTTSSGATTKTVNELVRDIRDAVANGIMSESDVRAIISEIVGQAPEALDTLEEVAEALSGIYTKSQVDSILSDYYTKTQIDTTINSRVNKDVIAPTYDDSSAYAVGDYVFYGDVLYRCNTAIGSSGESWNATHWTAVIVTNGIDGQGGLTPEQLALIENAQWKNEETAELFNETLEGWRGGSAELSYSDEITADPLYVTFNSEEYVCPRNEYFGMICYGGFGSKGPDFSEYPFYIIRNGDKNTVTPSYSSTQTFTISARGTTTTYTDAFKEGVEKYNCTYVKDYIDPQTNNKTSGVIEGDVARNVASGNFSHAEGTNTTASGTYSHAEGGGTAASGLSSHAEGADTTASGSGSHAEGSNTTASGYGSHTEGTNTTASGSNSHAEGFGTNAKSRSQHVFGEFNVADPSTSDESVRGTYVEIVGNGTRNTTRSNARTLDWSGNESLAGGLTLGKGTANETELTAAKLKEIIQSGSSDVIVIPITFVSEEYVEENQNYHGKWSSSETYSTGAIVSIEDEDANTLYYYLPSEDYADSEDIPGKSYKWEEYTPKPEHYHMNYHPEQIIRDAANGISMIAVTDKEDREFIEGHGYTFILSEATSLIPGVEGDNTVYGRITFTRFSSDENAIESICFDDVISWNSENIEEFNGIDLSISKLSVASTDNTISVGDIATEFDMYKDYVTGDLVFYKGKYYGVYRLFRCISPVTNGSEWNEKDWEEICINDMYVPKDSIAPKFDSTVAYNNGDIVWYNNRLYKANTSIASGNSFNDSNWNRTTIMEELLSS